MLPFRGSPAKSVSQTKGKRLNGQARRQLWLTCTSYAECAQARGNLLNIEQRDCLIVLIFDFFFYDKRNPIMKPKPLNPKLKKRARSMRKCMTPQESRMWIYCLKRLPFHFRRQDVSCPFIADFTCRKAKLVIEIDGAQHYSDCGKNYDEWRSGKLNEKGYMVLRFTNEDIEKRFDIVCDMVLRVTEARIKELEGKL